MAVGIRQLMNLDLDVKILGEKMQRISSILLVIFVLKVIESEGIGHDFEGSLSVMTVGTKQHLR